MLKVERFTSVESLFTFACDHIVSHVEKTGGPLNIAVSGGSTPLPLFKILGEHHGSSDAWKSVNIFWVDERWVPYEDAESNFGSAMRAGLQRLPAHFFPFDTSIPPADACSKYRSQLSNAQIGSTSFDLVVLGAGADGHTASVFLPDIGQATGSETVIVTKHPETGQVRLSLSLNIISQAKEILLILNGAGKKHIVQKLLRSEKPYYPIEHVVNNVRSITLLTDNHE